ncbi:MAG TPA: hypothetical protein VF508_13970, partial [Pyrinomonadaceae bacterium]
MHPTADTLPLILLQRLGAAGDAGRWAFQNMPAMNDIVMRVPAKGLLLTGWGMFLFSIFLPVNVSIGGLTDPGQSHHGFINLMYSL